MARKRMLSPDIWESESFSSLSDLAKIVFISLISHADDEGRGKASAGFVKSMTFPYDEGKRVTDISKALSEIAQKMSVRFYNVNGSKYYCLTNWNAWQKIDKPSKSKLPAPPTSGVGGLLPENEENSKFVECSANSSRTLVEGSSPKENIIEENKNLKEREMRACTHVTHKEILSILPGLIVDEKYRPKRTIEEYKAVKSKIDKSSFARQVFKRLKDVDNHYEELMSGKYEDFNRNNNTAPKVEKTYTSEQLNAMFDYSHLTEEELYDII